MVVNLLDQLKALNHFIKKFPVDVEGLVLALGGSVNRAYLADDISGMLECENDKFFITVNEEDSETRQRFTIAHEIGHYMLHRSLIGEGLDDSRAYRSTDKGKYHNTKIGKQQEIEANRFAAQILMPKNEVGRLKAEQRDVYYMASHFNVSKEAMSIRADLPL